MKKVIFGILGLVVIAISAITSCKKVDEVPNSNFEKLNFKSFEKYGDIHNNLLSNFKNGFEINPDIIMMSDGIDHISQFNVNSVMKLGIDNEEKKILVNSLEKHKRFVNTSEFYNELFVSNLKNKEEATGLYFESIKQAHNLGIIDDFEFTRISLIGQIVKDNHDGLISNYELKSTILQLKDEWIAKGYSIDSDNGHALAITLAISLASIEWWEENPSAFDSSSNRTKALPAWAAADIVGAGYSAVVAGIGSYSTTGEVNWGAVGIAAGGGAVAGSTGIIGKAGKWLSNLF